MKSRSVGLAVALMAVLLTATACIDCGHPDVDFALASDVVKQWVGDCLAGHEPGDKWSAATPAEGNANCAFLVRMNGWSSRSVKIISIESRPSVLCAGDIWVFLERGMVQGGARGSSWFTSPMPRVLAVCSRASRPQCWHLSLTGRSAVCPAQRRRMSRCVTFSRIASGRLRLRHRRNESWEA